MEGDLGILGANEQEEVSPTLVALQLVAREMRHGQIKLLGLDGGEAVAVLSVGGLEQRRPKAEGNGEVAGAEVVHLPGVERRGVLVGVGSVDRIAATEVLGIGGPGLEELDQVITGSGARHVEGDGLQVLLGRRHSGLMVDATHLLAHALDVAHIGSIVGPVVGGDGNVCLDEV